MIKPELRCPLCGARMTPIDMMDACTEIANAELGVLAARCPHCQGQFEIRPATDQIDLGYCGGTTVIRFDVALSLAVAGLVVKRGEDLTSLVLNTPDRVWKFREYAK